MGKTYRQEKRYKRVRETEDNAQGKHQVDHDHERTTTRRKLHDALTHWQDDDFEDENF